MIQLGLVPLVALLFVATPQPAQPPRGKIADPRPTEEKKEPRKGEKKDPTSRDLLRWLEEPLDVTPYQTELTLKQVLTKFSDAFAAKGKDLPLLVDVNRFKEENPDAPDLYVWSVKFPPFPRRMRFRDALTLALSKIPTNNATFVVRRGCVEITTLDRAAPHRLLQEKVSAIFEKRPLAEALDELVDMTGATLVWDPRVAKKAKTPITATLRNSVSLEGAVRLLTEMAGLHARIDDDSIIFITNRRKEGSVDKDSDLRLRGRPFYLALKDLSRWSGTSIILDPDAENWDGFFSTYPTKCPVTATFKPGTSPRAAAAMLSHMVGLEVVAIDNAVLVTTPPSVTQWRAELKKLMTKRDFPK